MLAGSMGFGNDISSLPSHQEAENSKLIIYNTPERLSHKGPKEERNSKGHVSRRPCQFGASFGNDSRD